MQQWSCTRNRGFHKQQSMCKVQEQKKNTRKSILKVFPSTLALALKTERGGLGEAHLGNAHPLCYLTAAVTTILATHDIYQFYGLKEVNHM